MYRPDLNNNIVNLSNSFLKRFGVEPFHPTIKKIDDLIKDKKRILVFLFDGMGKNILETHLPNDSFFRSHVIHTMDATYPPTTVASTNSFMSGRYPIEIGWLGWSQYFKEVNRNVAVFWNQDDDTNEYLGDDYLIYKHCGYKRFDQLINEKNGKNIAKWISGYPIEKKDRRVRFLNKFVNRAFAHANSKEESFTYAYWNCPDSKMHSYGINAPQVHQNILKIQKLIKSYIKKYPDVTVFVIADHGLIDITYLVLDEHPDLLDTLERTPSLEARTSNFFVKKGRQEEFKELFTKYYGEHFELYTKKEVFDLKLFGEGKEHPMAKEFIGDFLAVSKDQNALMMHDYKFKLKAHHAGGTLDEFKINVMYFGN